MPAIGFTDIAAKQGGNGRSKVHAYVKDRETPVPLAAGRRIERADNRGDVRLEETVTANQQSQRSKKREALNDHDKFVAFEQGTEIEPHQKLTGGHQDAAKNHGAPLPQEAVGQPTAEKGRHVDHRRIGAIYGIGVLVAVAEKALHHVEHQQRPHAVEGEPLPHFGKEEREQPGWMTKDGWRFDPLRRADFHVARRDAGIGTRGSIGVVFGLRRLGHGSRSVGTARERSSYLLILLERRAGER